MNNNFISKYNTFLLAVLFAFVAVLVYTGFRLESKKRVLKSDIIELYDIKYGMFNVDIWKEKISAIVAKKVKELKLEGEDKEIARQKISKFLYTVVDEYERNYKEENRRKALLGLSLKNAVANYLDIFDSFRENIPEITENILLFLSKEENQERIKNYILKQLDTYSANTFQKIDYTAYNQILKKYKAHTADECKALIDNEMRKVDKNLSIIYIFLPFLWVVVMFLLFRAQNENRFSMTLYILIALMFLLPGLLLPMIDIDARISSMEFKLLGETISFKDQVLYYKSKSILEVAQIMLSQSEIKIVLVGVLVLVLSLLFPLFKLLFSLVAVFRPAVLNHKAVNFIVLKSGKWSMADVMVVAIFMAYIGFSGIISGQLAQLEKITDKLNIITTNNSELQSGFFFFTGFVLMSIAISQKIYSRFSG